MPPSPSLPHPVFTTPELLTLIFSHLTFTTLLHTCPLVSKTWHATINTTPSLLRILYMFPSPPSTPTSLHPFLCEKESFPLYLEFPRHEKQWPGLVGGGETGTGASLDQGTWTVLHDQERGRERTPLEKFNFEGASWRRMVVLTGLPMITRARINETIELKPPLATQTLLYKRKSIQHYASGFRFGDLARLCEGRWSKRQQPLQAVVKILWMRGGQVRSAVFQSRVVVDTVFEGGDRGWLGWVLGVRERRRAGKEREREGGDQVGLERVEGVEYVGGNGTGWGEVLGEEEVEVHLMMARATARLVRWEEFGVGLESELVRKRFVRVVESES